MTNKYFVYIMSNYSKTLYVGMTNNIVRRVYEHKAGLIFGFTAKYRINQLVFVEETNDINEAIAYEKKIKGWTRKKKIQLIESMNPNWDDWGKDLI